MVFRRQWITCGVLFKIEQRSKKSAIPASGLFRGTPFGPPGKRFVELAFRTAVENDFQRDSS